MPSFETQLSDPNLKFTQRTPRQRPDAREGILKATIAGAKVVGKQIAKTSASDLYGSDLTQEDIEVQAGELEEQINLSLAQGASEKGQVLDPTETTNIKNRALERYSKDYRTLRYAQEQGVISSTEARARFQVMTQKALSNPINAMFKDEFMNAAPEMTGGSAGALRSLFPLTVEEEKAARLQKERLDAEAEHEKTVTSSMIATNKSRPVIEGEIAKDASDKRRIAEIELKQKERTITGEEETERLVLQSDGYTRNVMKNISILSQQAGGKGMNVDGSTMASRDLNNSYQAQLAELNQIQGMSSESRTANTKRINEWYKGMQEVVKLYSLEGYNEDVIKSLDQFATLETYKVAPMMMLLQKNAPSFAELIMKQGGNLQMLDYISGEGTAEKLKSSTKKMENLLAISTGEKTPHPEIVVPTFTSTNEGVDAYVNTLQDAEMKARLKAAYIAAPENNLNGFRSPLMITRTATSPELKQEVGHLADIGLRHLQNIQIGLGLNGVDIQIEEDIPVGDDERFRAHPTFAAARLLAGGPIKDERSTLVINIPDLMKDNASHVEALYDVIKKHSWAWEYKQDDYQDAKEAFNGFMRGEWQFDVDGSQLEAKQKGDGNEIDTKLSGDDVRSDIDSTSLLPSARTDRGTVSKKVAQPTAQAEQGGLTADDFNIDIEEVKVELVADEGSSSKVYDDSEGNKTIGVGFNLEATGASKLLKEAGIEKSLSSLKKGKETLEKAEIDALHDISVNTAVEASSRLFDMETMPKEAASTVVNVVYNMGASKVKSEFKRFTKAIQERRYADAAEELRFVDPDSYNPKLTDYIKQTKERGMKQILRLRALGNQNG